MYFRVLIAILLAYPVVCQVQQQPFIYRGGVVNAASFTPHLMPGGGIARGSMFSIFGARLGPATAEKAQAYPLHSSLAGVSITLRQGPRQFPAIPIYVSPSQVNAILPSNAPLGAVSFQVSFNSQNSNWVTSRVVDHAPAVFTTAGTGRGWSIFQNFTVESPILNSGSTAARPGQPGTLWLTGTGPISEPDNVSPPIGDLPYNIEIFVGDRPVTRKLYAGRAPGNAGVDSYVFVVPEDTPRGCFVPVFVRVNGAVSNASTIAVMPEGGDCSDAHNPVARALINGGKIVHALLFRATTGAREFAGIDVEFSADKAAIRTMEERANPFAFDAFLAVPPAGACTSYTMRGNVLENGLEFASAGRPLDLGALSISSAGGDQPLTPLEPGVYNTTLGGGFPALLSLFFGQGPSALRSSGGADGRGFDVPISGGGTLAYDSAAVRTITRSGGLRLSWTGQAGVSALVAGAVYDRPTNTSGLFLCVSPAGVSSQTVPDYVLANLPPTRDGTNQSEARLFFGAMPALRETVTPDQVRIFAARQDLRVQAIQVR